MASAASEREIKRRADLESANRENDKATITLLMSTVSGRKWLWNILASAQLFVGDEVLDPYHMAFEKGRRNSGLRLLQSINRHTPAHYIRMLEENSGVVIKEETDDRSSDAPE